MKTKILLLFLFIGSTSFAQSKLDSWKELKDFHEIMAATFHPSQENNLKPIKTRATEMKEKATALADSKIPAEFNNDKVKAAVKKLQAQSVVMEKMVTDKATDKEITNYLATVHETFHQIIGLCSPDEEQGKEEHNKEQHSK